MSKRTERRAAERTQRKLAYQQLRQQRSQSAAISEQITPEPVISEEPFLETSEAAHLTSEQISESSTTISEAQLKANRANALLSRGPQSSEGKAISSQNALKHGLTSQTVVLPSEDQAQYDHSLRVHIQGLKPVTDEELRLVQSIVDHKWRITRCMRVETALLRRGQIEFEENFPDHNPADQELLSLAELYLKYEKPLRNLHIQENRLRRNLDKDTAALRELQATRIREEQQQASHPQPKNPNGFVFTTTTSPNQQPSRAGRGLSKTDDLHLSEAA